MTIRRNFTASVRENALTLYERHASLPIIDYHGHLPPARLASNAHFRDLSELWIEGDHYKWRAMRIAGEREDLCTGSASPKERFDAWARTITRMASSPMQAWCQIELKRTFGITAPLTPSSAECIWEEANAMLATEDFQPRKLLARAGVEVLCTTDDPADQLEAHRQLAEDQGVSFRVFPTFRPDSALCLHSSQNFHDWRSRLEACSGIAVESLPTFMEALRVRYEFFHKLGCRVSDHGLDRCYATPCSDAEATTIFSRLLLNSSDIGAADLEKWRSWFMRQIAEWNHESGWTMMLHLGARRNNNTRIFSSYGLDAGCDSIGDFPQGETLVAFLDQLDTSERLPKTILFNSNPRDTLMFATIAGSFWGEGIRGKVQHGPPWWFLDQLYGIEEHLNAQCATGVLGTFVGMASDSRSFLSTARHEYFRKALTLKLAEDLESGLFNPDQVDIDELCRDLFYVNAQSFFGWKGAHGNS